MHEEQVDPVEQLGLLGPQMVAATAGPLGEPDQPVAPRLATLVPQLPE